MGDRYRTQRPSLWVIVLLLGRLERTFLLVESAAFVLRKPFYLRRLQSWHSTPHTQHVPGSDCECLSTKVALCSIQKAGKNEGDQEEPENASSPGHLRRKRNQIKEWISSRSSSKKSPILRPIRLEDGNFAEVESWKPTVSGLKANFSDLLAGIQCLNDILGDEKEGDPNQAACIRDSEGRDDGWFDDERKEIEANYQEIYQEMVAQLLEQRRKDPEGVPGGAEAMIREVLKQELKSEIEAIKEARREENLEKYADQKSEETEIKDLKGVSNEMIESLLMEDQNAKRRVEAARARVDEYRRYELEAFLRNQRGGGRIVLAPEANTDLDQWALQRLQEKVAAKEEGEDESFIVTDVIEDSLEDSLEDSTHRIVREAGHSSRIQPETLKEWQMYRAISSRRGMPSGAAVANASEEATEEQIAAQLQSWKEYIVKEDVAREKSGLARGPKLPFEWQESSRDKEIEDAQIKAELERRGDMTTVDIRREVNRKSLEALEKLLETSDAIRGARLRKDIGALKEKFEANDYLDIDESALEGEGDYVPPVDITSIFTSRGGTPTNALRLSLSLENAYDGPTPSKKPTNTSYFNEGTTIDRLLPLPPRATLFFALTGDVDIAQGRRATPFSSLPDQNNTNDVGGSVYRLGTLDEQKLRAMYQRGGARTGKEKDVIRAQWEEFERLEKSWRDASGLTDGDDSTLLNRADINYDISDVTKEDGDFNAEKILASIGPRPTRKRKALSADPTPPAYREDLRPPTCDVHPAEELDCLDRVVSAVDGDRTKDDPEAKAQNNVVFSKFIAKENGRGQSLDRLSDEIAAAIYEVEGETNEDGYAEVDLSSHGPRPKPRRRKIGATEYSDRSIALSASDDERENEEQTTRYTSEPLAPEDDLVPGWLRKEGESARSRRVSSRRRGRILGIDSDAVYDDVVYDHNMLEPAEYDLRGAGGRMEIGVNISDILGRSADAYADYNFDGNYFRAQESGWGTSEFEFQKANLLDYTELNLIEINSVMDYKDSIYSTGMSQFLPRINKPFKEFGAIFRLEGVLVETTGSQYKAWTRVAKEKGFKPPNEEEVRRASVLRSDVAVREAFVWTDDVILCQEAASAHQQALGEVFNEWMKESSIFPKSKQLEKQSNRGIAAMGEEKATLESEPDPTKDVDEGEKFRLLADAWSRTAVTYRLTIPAREQLLMASAVSPDIAVRKAFHWSEDQSQIFAYIATFHDTMKDLLGIPNRKTMTVKTMNPAPQLPRPVPDESACLEIQFKAWSKLAEENGFDMPLPEEVLAAVVINEPEIAIRDGFGWTQDSTRLAALIASYRNSFSEFVREFKGEASTPVPIVSNPDSQVDVKQCSANNDNWPTEQEMVEMQQNAWKSAASSHGYETPPVDQLLVAMKMTPSEAITRLFGWTSDATVVRAVCKTFDSVLKDISQTYIEKSGRCPGAVLFPDQLDTETAPRESRENTDDVLKEAWNAWNNAAKEMGFPMPDEEQVLFALSVGLEEAVVHCFQWASEPADVNKIVDVYKAELLKRRQRHQGSTASAQPQTEKTPEALSLFSVNPGVEKWVKSLLDAEMQCAVISYLNREQVDVLLEVSGLSHLFSADKRLTASDNYGREMDQLLGAALRLERRPDHCVLFDTSPNSAVTAHDVDMKCIAVIGPYPRYDLLAADSTASSFEELTGMNIRRLFGDRIYDQPMVDMQQADPEKNTRAKTRFFWDDD